MVLLAKRVSALCPPEINTSNSSAVVYFFARSKISCVFSLVSIQFLILSSDLEPPAAWLLAGNQVPLYALPTFIFVNLAGEAPWPVPMVCMGWPLPQFGVPHSVQASREQIASQLFQNSVVIPL